MDFFDFRICKEGGIENSKNITRVFYRKEQTIW